MDKIFKSASKLVFLALTLTACAGFLLSLLPVDQYMLLATGAYAYYFARKDSGMEK